MKSRITKFTKQLPPMLWRWLNRNCNNILVLSFMFLGYGSLIEKGAAVAGILSLMCFFLWLLAFVIRDSLWQVLDGLFKTLGR